MDKLETASENPEKIAELESAVTARGAAAKDEKVPQWASWALNAITGGKFYKGAAQPSPQQSAGETPPRDAAPQKAVSGFGFSGKCGWDLF